jgi:hypothetical protein
MWLRLLWLLLLSAPPRIPVRPTPVGMPGVEVNGTLTRSHSHSHAAEPTHPGNHNHTLAIHPSDSQSATHNSPQAPSFTGWSDVPPKIEGPPHSPVRPKLDGKPETAVNATVTASHSDTSIVKPTHTHLHNHTSVSYSYTGKPTHSVSHGNTSSTHSPTNKPDQVRPSVSKQTSQAVISRPAFPTMSVSGTGITQTRSHHHSHPTGTAITQNHTQSVNHTKPAFTRTGFSHTRTAASNHTHSPVPAYTKPFSASSSRYYCDWMPCPSHTHSDEHTHPASSMTTSTSHGSDFCGEFPCAQRTGITQVPSFTTSIDASRGIPSFSRTSSGHAASSS